MDEGHYEGRAVGLPGQPAPPVRRPPVRPEPVVTTQEEFRLPPEILRALQLSKDLENPLGPRLGGMPPLNLDPRGGQTSFWDTPILGEPSALNPPVERVVRRMLPNTLGEAGTDVAIPLAEIAAMYGGGSMLNLAKTGTRVLGTPVRAVGERLYGPTVMHKLFEHLPARAATWMRHGDDPLAKIFRRFYPNRPVKQPPFGSESVGRRKVFRDVDTEKPILARKETEIIEMPSTSLARAKALLRDEATQLRKGSPADARAATDIRENINSYAKELADEMDAFEMNDIRSTLDRTNVVRGVFGQGN
jgi:hypothetical protein